MINEGLVGFIEKEKRKGDFVYPFFDGYCFSNIPSTVLKFFGIKSRRTVLSSKYFDGKLGNDGSDKFVLVIIDGFGFDQWLRYYRGHEFFGRLTERGAVSSLTAVFPSTTANAITTVNTGLTPQEHGLPEWFVYFREIDMIINTVHFKPLGSRRNDELLEMGVDPKVLYDGDTIYQKMKNEDVKTFTFIDKAIAQSVYSRLVFNGSTIRDAVRTSDLIVNLRKHLEKEDGPAFYYVYLGSLDSVGHRYGPFTEEYGAELSSLSFQLHRQLIEKISRKAAKECLLCITADHGQVNVDPKKTFYLNRYSRLVQSFQKSSEGNVIFPTGSPRDVFLHVKPDNVKEACEFLSGKLGGRAEIMETEEAFEMGLFGTGESHREFFSRMGNVLVLPHNNFTVWYEHPEGRKFDLLGHHGGLTGGEMFVPLAVANLSSLK